MTFHKKSKNKQDLSFSSRNNPQSKVMIWVRFFGVTLLLVGTCFLYGSYNNYQEDRKFSQIAVSTTGTVIDLIPITSTKRDDRGRERETTTYKPIVQFVDQQGQTQEYQDAMSSSPPPYRRGEKVEILYDPDNPEFAVINSFTQRYFATIVLGVLGVMCVLGGLTALKVRREDVSISIGGRRLG